MKKLTKKISEVSTKLLDKYTASALDDYERATKDGDYKKSFKRAKGMMQASGKKIDNDVKDMKAQRGVTEDPEQVAELISFTNKPAEPVKTPKRKPEMIHNFAAQTNKNVKSTFQKAKDAGKKNWFNVKEDANQLNVGDPVIITGDVEYQGATGDVQEIARDGAFVVVNLYNHGEYSFHSSDVEYNDYADSDAEQERMYDAGEYDDADLEEQGVAEGSAADGSVDYTLGHPVDKEYVYHIYRDGKKEGTYHSLDQAKQIVANMKRTSGHRKYKITRSPRSKLAGPQGQLPEGVAEGMFGLSTKEKGAIMNLTSDLSDIPGMWDHNAQTFTDAGKEQLTKLLKNNSKHIKYALNLTSKDYEAEDMAEGAEYGIPDATPGQLPGGAKMTFGEFKKLWPNVILKRPSGGSLAGSVVADVEGWMNNPKSVWEPLTGVTEVSNSTLRSYSKKAEKELATPGAPVKQNRVDGVVRAANKRYAKDSEDMYGKVKESLRRGEYYVHTVHFADGSTAQIQTYNDEQTDADIKAFYAKQGKDVVKVDYDWGIKGEQEVLDESRRAALEKLVK